MALLSSDAKARCGVDQPSDPDGSLIERLIEEMARGWRQGERPLAEEYLLLHPHLRDRPEAALELVYEEIHLREEQGQEVQAEDLLVRFPQWRRQVEALLECHHLLSERLAEPLYPAAGETLGTFRLLAELGRGSQSRVFLATQPSLADRSVVLKLGPRNGSEHLSLARLQHTHIVPLHSVHEFPARRLCALCLPFFGGTTLDRLLRSMHERPPRQRTGQHIWEALHQARIDASAAPSHDGPCHRFLQRATYGQAICWIGACLADALHYAHERGLLHLDLKPSNVLLSADGQPLLLDFHLARSPLPAGSPAPLWLGGTPGYMAPEQQAALDAVAHREPVPLALDAGADIYALGMLLYEALAGRPPSPKQTPQRTLRRLNPQVSVGLADIVDRCLQHSCAERYSKASELASDLRRHLADLPLRGVSNRSLLERWRKWRRRRRHTLPVLSLLFVVLLALGGALHHTSRQVYKAKEVLRDGQTHLDQQHYAEVIDTLKYGLALIEDLPCNAGLRHQLQEKMQEAERGQAVQELHSLSERVRPLYSATILPEAQARTVEAHCRAIWQQRAIILARLRPLHSSELEQQVRADLLDLAILGIHLRVRQAASGTRDSARKEALQCLDEVEGLLGHSCVLFHERQAHALALGLTNVAQAAAQQADAAAPQSAWEHCAVGLVHFRAGDYRRAAEAMRQALELDPHALWPNFHLGSCCYHLGCFEEAFTAFSVCVALAPQCAWCYANRGLACTALGRLESAVNDYNHALRLDPTLRTAFLDPRIRNRTSREH